MRGITFGVAICVVISALAVSSTAAREIDFPKAREGGKAIRFTLRLTKDATPLRMKVADNDGKEVAALELRPDKKGLSIAVFQSGQRGAGSQEKPVLTSELIFWPKTGSRALPGVAGLAEQTWRERDLPGLLRLESHRVQLWLEGMLVLNEALPVDLAYHLNFLPGAGTTLHFAETNSAPSGGLYQEVDLSHLISKPGVDQTIHKDGIPFEVRNEGQSLVSLADAGWPEWKTDPGSFTETYDGGVYLLGDKRMPMVQVPKADYSAAYLLAYADDGGKTSNRVTLRMGRRIAGAGKQSQVYMIDFGADVPRDKGLLQVVKIPLTEAFSQDIEGNILDIELTKEIRLARRSPDPNRFRWRPLGLPSGVKIAGMTLERSPIQMKIEASEVGALFELPKPAGFLVSLDNITEETQNFELNVKAGAVAGQTLEGEILAGGTFSGTITLPNLPPGYYPVTFSLKKKSATEPLLVRHTAVGVLPADSRKYRDEAPWGTWDHNGGHFTPFQVEVMGPLMRKLGLRYGMFNADYEGRKRYGVIKGNHFKVGTRLKNFDNASDAYRAALEKHPDLLPDVLIFHEDSISGGHASRVPDLFHDHPPYRLNEQEKKRFDEMWSEAIAAAKAIRKDYPEVKLHLGNGPIPLREEFYRHKFPADLFDAGGNENPSFSRIPETQPPDPIGNNSSLWMDRQLLDAYGYKDKAVSQAHETIYPSSNPGNLSHQTQADYFVRNILHSMAWGMPRIRPGSIVDAGSSYYYSNWGGVGLLTRQPSIAPKPAAIAVATLTSVLDGALYDGFLDTGSESAYLPRFRKKDGSQVLPFWVVRGERDYTIAIEGASHVRVISPEGAGQEKALVKGAIRVTATSSPAWLELPPGASIKDISLGSPRYPRSEPQGKVAQLDALTSLEGWTIPKEANPLLDYYNPMTPRRKGEVKLEPVAKFEGSPALRVTPGPMDKGKATMPMYVELVRDKVITLPGKPAEIGLWVNGNSAWGRIIFELEDASGQRWISIGAKAKGGSDWMADWLGKDLAGDYKPGEIADWNTDDAWGLSRINFDGWRYLPFPLPGQYPGEGYHWPANSQWNWNKDGIVHYPLALKKVIVELPEKTLHLTRYEPAKRPEIYVRNLVSVERDLDVPKREPGDYVEAAQITVD